MASTDSGTITEIDCEGDECKVPLLSKMLEEMSNPGGPPALQAQGGG